MSHTKSIDPTDDRIDTAILSALAEAGEDPQPWAAVRRRVPGSLDQKNQRLIELWLTGRVWMCKIAGRNYVAVGDADDVRLAAASRARGHVRAPFAL